MPDEIDDTSSNQLDFTRFDHKTIKVVFLAQDECRRMGINRVGTEHLLLGIIAEGPSFESRILRSMGVNQNCVLDHVKKMNRSDSRQSKPEFSPRVIQLLNLARTEAKTIGDDSVEIKHLVFALIRLGEGGAIDILKELGVSVDDLRLKIGCPLAPPDP